MKRLACMLLLLLSAPLHAQLAEPMEPAAPGEKRFLPPQRGTEVFGHILQHHALRPLPSVDAAVDALPSKTLIVIFGDLTPLSELNNTVPGGIPEFLRKGGSILIASDYRTWRRRDLFPRLWNVDISGQEVRLEDAGDGNVPQAGTPECPVITDGILPEGNQWLFFRHPIFADLKRGLLTNNPTHFTAQGTSLFTLARFSKGTIARGLEWGKDRFFDQDATRLPYIMGSSIASPPSGRVLLIAGHGVFINSTMVQREYDNIAFAANVVRWLGEGPNGPRDNVLFIEDQRVITSLGVPLVGPSTKLPTPQISPDVIINRVIDAVQKDRIVQRIAEEEMGTDALRRYSMVYLTMLLVALGLWRLRDRTPRGSVWLPMLLAILCAVILISSGYWIVSTGPNLVNVAVFAVGLIGASLLFRHHYKAATSRIPPAPVLMGVQQGSRGPNAFRLRLRELTASGNLWEPAQVLVRDWFHRHAGLEPFATPSTSPLMVPGGPFRNRGLRGRLDSAWRFLAAPPRSVKPKEFQQLSEDLDELSFALQEGKLAMVATTA